MAKELLKPGTFVYPVPVLMVSAGNKDGVQNVMTAGWTGTVCTNPPMAYVSIRPGRFTYDLIKESGEFVLNLTTKALARATDLCGVKSARDGINKWELAGITPEKANVLEYAPLVAESPLSIECKVHDILELGTHHMVLGDVVGISVRKEFVDENKRLSLYNADLIAYSNVKNEKGMMQGGYVSLAESLGCYGFTVKEKIGTH